MGPLTYALEQHQAGKLGAESAAETQALKFLGNASANISVERRKQVASFLNEDLRSLVEEEDQFTSAAPFLFGKEFEKGAKEHIDSVKSLRKFCQPRDGGQRKTKFFRTSRPYSQQQTATRGGGTFQFSSRGGARGRYRPYQTRDQRQNGAKQT